VAGYWIDPQGTAHDVPHFMHEAFARSRGAHGIRDLIKHDWIRTIVHDGAFNFQLSTYKDDSALERIEDFLSEHASVYGRWGVTLETENPLEPPIHIMDRDIEAMGLKDAIAREVRLHRLKPFGMMGLDEEREGFEFYGEFSSCIETPDGIRRQKERFWYDPEVDDFICERTIG